MQETYIDMSSNASQDEINFQELFSVLFLGKWIIISISAFASLIAVIYSLMLPNIYESRALLVPVNSSSNISGALGGYSSLAGLAGINLPSGSDDGNTQKAIKKIDSLSFFKNNIYPNIYLPDLMAIKTWDSKTNILTYSEDIYDSKSSTWIRDYSYPQQQIPSAQESYMIFHKKHLRLGEDKKTGFINLSIKHQSPHIAHQWAMLIINEINNFYRSKDKLESEKAASYLDSQISSTNFSEIKEALAQLLQEQTKKLALIEANQYYVFDFIDPPEVMEIKTEPNRAFICIVGALLGGMLSILYVLIRHYLFSQKTK